MEKRVLVIVLVSILFLLIFIKSSGITTNAIFQGSVVGRAISSLQKSSGDEIVSQKNLCGNGIVDFGESCDFALRAQPQCSSIRNGIFVYESGNLNCRTDCRFDSSSCVIRSECSADLDGNGIVNPADRGYVSANIGCEVYYANPACDASDVDGNGIVNSADRGFVSANFGSCVQEPVCGNNIQEGGEACDGSDLAGKKCKDFEGYSSGTLICNTCSEFDISQCMRTPVCGNDLLEEGEGCDCGLDTLCEEMSCSDVRSTYSGGEVHCTNCFDYDESFCSSRGLPLNIPPNERTADLPDSWLVLYNINNPESVEWKDWYIEQWGIPEENTLGLDVSNNEKITYQEFQDSIFNPVKNHLLDNTELNSRIMGIISGYNVPGNFYRDNSHPIYNNGPNGIGGGYSISSNLADLAYFDAYRLTNLKSFSANSAGGRSRLTKFSLNDGVGQIDGTIRTPNYYLTARIDAPTLEQAKDLTRRAKAITNGEVSLEGNKIYYDYSHPGAPAGENWNNLISQISNNIYAEEFGVGTTSRPATQNAAFRFSYYHVNGWNAPQIWSNTGARVLHFAMDSWGATTVRSTSGHQARSVPNALYLGGYAAAIGSTAEPYNGNEPYADTIIWSLSNGQTLGEAFFQSNRYVDFMWELNGDPLMRVPNWFN